MVSGKMGSLLRVAGLLGGGPIAGDSGAGAAGRVGREAVDLAGHRDLRLLPSTPCGNWERKFVVRAMSCRIAFVVVVVVVVVIMVVVVLLVVVVVVVVFDVVVVIIIIIVIVVLAVVVKQSLHISFPCISLIHSYLKMF
jgi:hypothetical protein